VRYPNFYGIDLPHQSDLLAFGLGEDEIAESIGADGVVFQDLSDLEDCVSSLNPGIFTGGFENSMFTGEYLTRDGGGGAWAEGDDVSIDKSPGVLGVGGGIGGVGRGGSSGASVVDII
ncbi:unnamed protein product, partial [Choristocarpus tenellus]